MGAEGLGALQMKQIMVMIAWLSLSVVVLAAIWVGAFVAVNGWKKAKKDAELLLRSTRKDPK